MPYSRGNRFESVSVTGSASGPGPVADTGWKPVPPCVLGRWHRHPGLWVRLPQQRRTTERALDYAQPGTDLYRQILEKIEKLRK